VFVPDSYAVALGFLVVTMLCWGSWANTVKLAPGYRFQLFYWDYVWGLLLGTVVWGLTLGSMGSSGLGFLADVRGAGTEQIELALAGGITFNVANLLLVAAIDIAGLAVAFPVGIGLALVVGAVSSYLITPNGNPWMLFGGIALVMAAIVLDARAYGVREGGKSKASRRGVVLSALAGLLMGCFYPFVAKAMSGPEGVGPYAVAFFFAIGVLICSVPVNWLLMRKPLDGKEPVEMEGYFKAPLSFHLWGIVGGLIWCTGTTLNFVASRTQIVGPAVSYSIGQGATMVSAAWGVFIWREFANAPAKAKRLVWWMFLCFLLGLGLVAVSPLF